MKEMPHVYKLSPVLLVGEGFLMVCEKLANLYIKPQTPIQSHLCVILEQATYAHVEQCFEEFSAGSASK